MTTSYKHLSPRQRVDIARQHLQAAEADHYQQSMNLRKTEAQVKAEKDAAVKAGFDQRLAEIKAQVARAQVDIDTMTAILDEAAADLPADDDPSEPAPRPRVRRR